MGRVAGTEGSGRLNDQILSELVAKMLDRFPLRKRKQPLSTPAVTRGPLIKTSGSSDNSTMALLSIFPTEGTNEGLGS